MVQRPNKRNRFVFFLIGFVAAICTVGFVRFLVLSDARPLALTDSFRITGASMAETLRGTHQKATCLDCRFEFSCDFDHPPHDNFAVCPNCGFERNSLKDAPTCLGDAVTIDREAFATMPPQRWEIVAFRSPNDGEDDKELSVKRILGLPGEQISIRQGDIYVNDQIARKSLDQLRSMAILVHDNSYQPALDHSLAARWRTESEDSRWRCAGDGVLIKDSKSDRSKGISQYDLDWIKYHHWPCFPSLSARTDEAPIKDNYAFNQALTRKLHPVTDLLLNCRVTLDEWDRFVLRLDNGRHQFNLELSRLQNAIVLRRDDREVERVAFPSEFSRHEHEMELAFVDRRLIFAVDYRELLAHNIRSSSKPLQPSTRPLAIGAVAHFVRIRELQVRRDIHYLDPGGIGLDWSISGPLGRDEYLVLGDNVPLSVDSRQWKVPALDHKLFEGRVLESGHMSE